MGTHLEVLRESYPMNTNMTGFERLSKIFVSFMLWKEVALEFERLNVIIIQMIPKYVHVHSISNP